MGRVAKARPNAPLHEWLKLHRDNPYPTESERNSLAQATGLTKKQIDHWFVNARQRYCQPRRRRQPNPNYARYPQEVTDILTRWLVMHRDNTYPTSKERKELLQATGLRSRQLQNWLTNARKRGLVQRLRHAAQDAENQAPTNISLPAATAMPAQPQIVAATSTSLTAWPPNPDYSPRPAVNGLQRFRREAPLPAVEMRRAEDPFDDLVFTQTMDGHRQVVAACQSEQPLQHVADVSRLPAGPEPSMPPTPIHAAGQLHAPGKAYPQYQYPYPYAAQSCPRRPQLMQLQDLMIPEPQMVWPVSPGQPRPDIIVKNGQQEAQMPILSYGGQLGPQVSGQWSYMRSTAPRSLDQESQVQWQ